MKLFWKSREGKHPPSEAVFSWTPFFSSGSVQRLEPIERIETLPPPLPKISTIKSHFLPEKKGWIKAAEQALEEIEAGEMEKVVLARTALFECRQRIDPFALAAALQPKAENANLFCLADGNIGFVSATPERLFTRKVGQIEAEAVAGTRRRGQEEDLLQREKEMREFLPVQTFLQKTLSPFCNSLPTFSLPTIRRSAKVAHISSLVTGTLKEGVPDGKIASLIHPTPALSGAPTKKALDWIRKNEPFERGLYGSAFGWNTKEESEWIVAIRCCLIEGNYARLYVGAGIVKGSDPEEEWDELNAKMELYQGIFF